MKINQKAALAIALLLIGIMGYFVLASAQGVIPFWRGIGLSTLCGIVDFFWIGLSGISEEE